MTYGSFLDTLLPLHALRQLRGMLVVVFLCLLDAFLLAQTLLTGNLLVLLLLADTGVLGCQNSRFVICLGGCLDV